METEEQMETVYILNFTKKYTTSILEQETEEILQVAKKYIDDKLTDLEFIDLMSKDENFSLWSREEFKSMTMDDKLFVSIQNYSTNAERVLMQKRTDFSYNGFLETDKQISKCFRREKNINILLNDIISILKINTNGLVSKKINLNEYMSKIRQWIITNGKFPSKGVDLFSKTFRDLIDIYLYPIYRIVITPLVATIENLLSCYSMNPDIDFQAIKKNNRYVRSYDLYHSSLLLEYIQLVLEYFSDNIFEEVNISGIISKWMSRSYIGFFSELPNDCLKLIFEFSGFAVLKFQKPISLPSENVNNISKSHILNMQDSIQFKLDRIEYHNRERRKKIALSIK